MDTVGPSELALKLLPQMTTRAMQLHCKDLGTDNRSGRVDLSHRKPTTSEAGTLLRADKEPNND